jgi:superoxide reductase
MGINELYKSGDWKAEKHVPVIEVEDTIKKGVPVTVTVGIGKQISHPNTTAHHISRIELYFLAEGDKFPYQLGSFEFTAHGASTQGADTSGVYTIPAAAINFQTERPGTLFASAYCNIHGLWENSKKIHVE